MPVKFEVKLFVFSAFVFVKKLNFFGKCSSFESHDSKLTSRDYISKLHTNVLSWMVYVLWSFRFGKLCTGNASVCFHYGTSPHQVKHYPRLFSVLGVWGVTHLSLQELQCQLPAAWWGCRRSALVPVMARPWRMAMFWVVQAWGSVTAHGLSPPPSSAQCICSWESFIQTARQRDVLEKTLEKPVALDWGVPV